MKCPLSESQKAWVKENKKVLVFVGVLCLFLTLAWCSGSSEAASGVII